MVTYWIPWKTDEDGHVHKTDSFNAPVAKDHGGKYKLKTEQVVIVCPDPDFFSKGSDGIRNDIWEIIHERQDLYFNVQTSHVDRVPSSLPVDWGDDRYSNVILTVVCSTQDEADSRLSEAMSLPFKYVEVLVEPMVERLDVGKYLDTGKFRKVIVSGGLGKDSDALNFRWVLDMSHQCHDNGVKFCFKRTGTNFVNEMGSLVRIAEKLQNETARSYGLDTEELVPMISCYDDRKPMDTRKLLRDEEDKLAGVPNIEDLVMTRY